jgi:hypothetical protein
LSLILSRLKFSEIDFTENPVAEGDGVEGGGLKSENIGCIQLVVRKRTGVKQDGTFVSQLAPSDTSSTKVWEKDKKVAGKISLATRYIHSHNLKFRRNTASKEVNPRDL